MPPPDPFQLSAPGPARRYARGRGPGDTAWGHCHGPKTQLVSTEPNIKGWTTGGWKSPTLCRFWGKILLFFIKIHSGWYVQWLVTIFNRPRALACRGSGAAVTCSGVGSGRRPRSRWLPSGHAVRRTFTILTKRVKIHGERRALRGARGWASAVAGGRGAPARVPWGRLWPRPPRLCRAGPALGGEGPGRGYFQGCRFQNEMRGRESGRCGPGTGRPQPKSTRGLVPLGRRGQQRPSLVLPGARAGTRAPAARGPGKSSPQGKQHGGANPSDLG